MADNQGWAMGVQCHEQGMPQHYGTVLPVQCTGMQLHAQGVDIPEYDGIVLHVQGWGMTAHVQGIREHDSILLPVQGRGMRLHAHHAHGIR